MYLYYNVIASLVFRSDSDCELSSKCCFDGCGLKCKKIEGDEDRFGDDQKSFGKVKPSSMLWERLPSVKDEVPATKSIGRPFKQAKSDEKSLTAIEFKSGECLPIEHFERLDCKSGIDECNYDENCPGIKKYL